MESTARQAADATAATNLSAAVVTEVADRNSAISTATAPLATTAALAAEATARQAAIATAVQNSAQRAGGAALAASTLPYADAAGALTTAAAGSAITVPGDLSMTGVFTHDVVAGTGVLRSNTGTVRLEAGATGDIVLDRDGETTPRLHYSDADDHWHIEGNGLIIESTGTEVLSDNGNNSTNGIAFGSFYAGQWAGGAGYACFQNRTARARASPGNSYAIAAGATTTNINAVNSLYFRIDQSIKFQCSATLFSSAVTIHAVSFYATSDRNKKHDVEYCADDPDSSEQHWEAIRNLRLATYFDDIEGSKKEIGVIAQDCQGSGMDVVRNAVAEVDTVDREGETHLAVDYSQLHSLGLSVTQQLMARVESLETQLAAMVAAQEE